MTIYSVEEVFEEIEGDSEHCLMNIPEEVARKAGFKPGDNLVIDVVDGVMTIKKAG